MPTNTIRIRAQARGGETTVKALITHPMETGQRKDKKTGKVIPAHFIQDLVCKHNGATVVTGLWGPAVSKNPYVAFDLKGGKAGDTIEMSWVDNLGEKDSLTTKVR
jgi:sulfur-oxidizing protein SoxZ